MPDVPIKLTPATALQRALVCASFAAVPLGLLFHRTWEALPAARFGESLALAALWAVVAEMGRRLTRLSTASMVGTIGLVLLMVMAGVVPVLATLLLAVASIALGSLFVRDAATAFVTGAALIAGLVGWLLPLPVHRTWTYALVLALMGLARRHALLATWRDAQDAARQAVEQAPRTAAWSMLALGLASTPAWLPTLQYDDLAYHLGLPWQLLERGRYAPDVSQQVWAYAPWAGDVLHGIVQVLARQEARGPLNAAWLVACAALLARITGQLGAPPMFRWISAALMGTLPPIAALLGGMQTELAATAAMLALASIALGQRAPGAPVAAGLLAGFLAALKLMHPAAGIGVIAWALARSPRAARGRALGAALLTALAVAGSSYVTAWRICANPVLPLLNGFFHSPCFEPVDFVDTRWTSMPGIPLPWSMTFMTGHHVEAFDGGFGFLLVAFAGAAFAALVGRRTRTPAACALTAIFVPLLVMPYARYAVPGLVLLVPPAVVAIARLVPRRPAVALLAALCVLDLGFQANAQWMLHSGAIKHAVRAKGRDAPLLLEFAPERLALAQLRAARPESTVLDLGGASHAELGGRGLTTLWYAPQLREEAAAADSDSTGASWARLLRQSRIDIVLLRDADATPARIAGLSRAGAHVILTSGPVKCWALPPLPSP